MSERLYKVRTPLMPTYSTVQKILQIWDGVPKAQVATMKQNISNQMGTPQNPVDWSNPDTWIQERLARDDRKLALRIWNESEKTVNPLHIFGVSMFINGHKLLAPDGQGIFHISERGKNFLTGDHKTIQELDDLEGLLELLSILSTKNQAKRGDLLPEWSEFLHEHSKFGSSSTIKDTLRRRLLNLHDRGLIERSGNIYLISEKGRKYLSEASHIEKDEMQELSKEIAAYNNQQRENLRERLISMSPYQFEKLVGELLDAMEYEDVTVTKQSGDKGVDVVANFQFGITSVKEVVQVKRHQGSLGRPALDQLRGSLPYHSAIRGTLITIGKFSSGCKEAALFPGAAPITLIDGEKLLDLLIKHEIGLRKRPVFLYEVDHDFFTTHEETNEDENEDADHPLD